MAVAEADLDADAAPAKKGKGKLLIMIGAGLAVVIVLAAVWFLFLAPKPAPAEDAHAAAVIEAPKTFIFNLPSMMVNLNAEGGTESFMKLTIALEVADEAMMTTIQPKMAKVVDAFQVYLRELRKSDLDGSAGIFRLKEELLRRVNVAIAPAHVNSVLFKEILVQ